MNQYFGYDCPNCGNHCIYDNGDPSDLTVEDVTYAKCWSCGCISKMPEWEDEEPELASNQKMYGASKTFKAE